MDESDEHPDLLVLQEKGDVILEIEASTPVRLLSSSKKLSDASAFFKNMFDGNWSEGQDLSTSAPPIVLLVDTDPNYMTILCKIIHNQMVYVPEGTALADFTAFADFAQTCDLYWVQDAVRPFAEKWAMDLLVHSHAEGYDKLLFATFVLDLPKHFYLVTQSIIRERAVPVDIIMAIHVPERIPLKLFNHIQRLREAHRSGFQYALLPRNSDARYINQLRNADLWHPRTVLSLQDYRARAERMHEIDREMKEMKRSICRNMDRYMNSIRGVCLDCFIADGKADGQRPSCRFEHGSAQRFSTSGTMAVPRFYLRI